MSETIDQGLDRLDRAMARLRRHGTVQRLHSLAVGRAGVDCDLGIYLVLQAIAIDGPLRVSDLARNLGVGPSTISRHAGSLEERGWVERQADETDRRAARLVATDAGSRTVELVEAERKRIMAPVLERWSDDDRRLLFELSERFASELQEHVERQ